MLAIVLINGMWAHKDSGLKEKINEKKLRKW